VRGGGWCGTSGLEHSGYNRLNEAARALHLIMGIVSSETGSKAYDHHESERTFSTKDRAAIRNVGWEAAETRRTWHYVQSRLLAVSTEGQ